MDPLEIKTRCPKLGITVSLSYCLRENNDIPCRFIFGCFNGLREELKKILVSMFSKEDLERAFSPPKDPYTRFFEIVEKAKKET